MRRILLYPLLAIAITLLSPALSSAQSESSSRAEKLLRYNQYADAVKHLSKKVKKQPTDPVLNEQLGFAYMKLQQFEAAEQFFERSDNLDGLSNEGLIFYGQTLIKNGHPSKAESLFERYIEREPESFVAQLMLRSINKVQTWDMSHAAFELQPVIDLNSEHSEFAPIPYKDGILFTTERHVDHITEVSAERNNAPYLAVYQSTMTTAAPEGFAFDRAKEFLINLNRDDHVGPIAMDTLRDELFYTVATSKIGRKNTSYLEIHRAKVVKDKRLKNDLVFLQGENYSVGHPCLSPSGDRMIFASDMESGSGKMDLYVIERTDSTGWTEPRNLSAVINSPMNEVFPYLKNDTTLFFASDGHLGYGGLDLFVSTFREGRWSKPVNLKAPINSPKDDFGIAYLNEYKGLFSSARDGGLGKDDIYGFVQISDIGDTQRVDLAGIFEYDNLPNDGVSLSLLDQEDNVLRTTQTDSTGQFNFGALPIDEVYKVRVNSDDTDLLLNSNIYVVNEAGEKVQVMKKDGAAQFVFTTLPKDEFDALQALDAQDRSRVYDLFGQLFTELKKDLADIELIAYTDDGEIYAVSMTDSSGYYSFLDLPKDEFLTIKVNPQDSTIYRSSVFYEEDEGITRISDSTGQYFRVDLNEIVSADGNVSKKAQYTVFIENDDGPMGGMAVALFDENDHVIHIAKTNEQASFTIFGTIPGEPYRLLLPESVVQLNDTSTVHLVDRVANRFIDGVPRDKRNHIFEALPPAEEVFEQDELAYLTQPVTIGGRVYQKLPGDFSEGMTLYAYDEDGNLVETVVTNEQGEFAFKSLRPDQNYMIRPDVEDASGFKFQLVNEEGEPGEELRLNDLQTYVYERLESEKAHRLEQIEEEDFVMPGLSNFVSGQIYYELPGDYMEGIKVYAFDEAGNIIDSTYTDGKGGFTFTRLAGSEDFSIKVLDESDSDLKVALYNYDGTFKGLLFLDENRSFQYNKIILEAAAELESEMEADQSEGLLFGQVYRKLPGDYSKGMTVYAFDADGNLIDAAPVDEEGNFQFTRLTKDQDYMFKFSEEDTEFNVSLLDAEGNEFDKAYATNGTWQYSKLELDKYKMKALAMKDNGTGGAMMDKYLKSKERPLPELGEETIGFGLRSTELTEEARNYLDGIIKAHKENPSTSITIASHSDPSELRGNSSYEAVRSALITQYLHNRGVALDKIHVTNWGAKQPLIECDGKPCAQEERERNARATVGLIEQDKWVSVPDYVLTYSFNDWRLNDDAEQVAYQLLQKLKSEPEMKVLIDGYADTYGSYSSNDRISELRVQNLQNLLLARGLEESQIETTIHGEMIPTGKCKLYYPCPLDERTQNRRVEVRLN